jgi:hypothetical protein
MFLAMLFFTTACQEDNFELGDRLSPADIDFEVVQDYSIDSGGNTVILRNNTPGTIAMWDFGTGRSTRTIDTVRYAFKGQYTINFSALTAGGVVEMDPVTIEVTKDEYKYIEDPLWIALTGGPGEEKTWLLDMEAKYFEGPLYFYGTNNGWLEGGNAWDGGDTGCYGDDCWNWSPVYADNTWLLPEGDYGTMTFSLKGGPFFTNVKPMEGGVQENGTYTLSVETKQLTINGASILRGYKGENKGLAGVSNWSNYTVLSLDENTMQLGVIRDKDIDGEGPAMLVYNFISKEYSDNWVPEEEIPQPDEGFDPTFAPGELLNMLTGGPSSGRVWVLDAAGNPVDWLASGTGWTTSHSDSRDWGWNNSWDAVAESSWIRFDRFGGAQNYTRSQNGTVTTGTFTINNETNEITLENNLLIQNPGSWMSPAATTIKVVKAFPGEFESKGIWFGTSYDAAKDEWFVFHYVLPE